MSYFQFLGLLIFLFSFSHSFAFDLPKTSAYEWTQIDEKDGIKVYRSEVKGSDVVAFRGDTVIEADIARVVSALKDMKYKTEWMHELKNIRVVEQVSKNQHVEYYHSGTPWPLDDRDFLYSARYQYYKKDRLFVLNMQSVEREDVPEVDGVVRGRLVDSNYFIRKGDKEGTTHMRVEILADPMGSIPKWIVNLFQKDWPIKTLTGLKKLMENPEFKTMDQVQQFFK